MSRGRRRRLLDVLRGRRVDALESPSPEHLPGTDVGRVRAAVTEARSGGRGSVGQLVRHLTAAANSGNAELAAVALGVLDDAAAALWIELDLVARDAHSVAAPVLTSRAESAGAGEQALPALVLESFHPVGFVREAAVVRLLGVPGGSALRALALRTGDWVDQVRVLARDAVERRLDGSVEAVLEVGPLALLLSARARGGWLWAQVERSIRGLDDPDLRRVLTASNPRLRRFGYVVALEHDRLTVPELLEAAQRDRDRIIKVHCAERALAGAVGEDATVGVAAHLISSGTAAVRVVAVVGLARVGRTDAIVQASADPSSTVRAVAQSVLRRAGVDPAEHYRALLRRSKVALGALAGLGETGGPLDADLIRPALTASRPRVRVEAVRALRRLGRANVQDLIGMLADPAPAVTRQVATTLLATGGDVPDDRLRSLLDPRNTAHTRVAAARILRARSVWSRLITDLELLDDEDVDIRSRALEDLLAWLHRDAATTYSTPTGHAAARLDELLQRAAPAVADHRVRALRFHLGLADRDD